ncbi:MAG TPA: histidine phosphatase family protein [Humisphaera sp.]|jgi:broad specificity phosphatase PhoE|nr:histidine phosphatase family protein [Humisphaera sp.]
MPTELLLIRHGESEANVGRSTDVDCLLTDAGIEQARQLGLRLAEHDLRDFLFLTSPYRRTVHTAAAITEATGRSFVVDERIREWGEFATIGGKQYPKETTRELVERLREFLLDHAGRKLVVVSHAAPIAVLTQLANGESPNTLGQFWIGVENCCSRRVICR